MDTHNTLSSSPATSQNSPPSRTLGWALFFLTVVAWPTIAEGQSTSIGGTQGSGSQHHGECGGDSLDGVCEAVCSGNPLETSFDADCMSCGRFFPPKPKRACNTPGQPCEIHEGIIRMGEMLRSARYDDTTMRALVLAYWDGAAWDLTQHWGGSALDGYVVYSIVRTAVEFREEIDGHPVTKTAMNCMLRDHASRGMPTTNHNGTRFFHGGRNKWNSWSEDYMGFALGYAAADAWLATTDSPEGYYDEFFDPVEEAVEMAFSTDEEPPLALTFADDPDPEATGSEPSVMLRNHNEYSPVYATVLLKHVADINILYRVAGLPPRFTCDNKPAAYDGLLRWVAGKIEANPDGGGYVYRSDGCARKDGVMSFCDDRPGDPEGSSGFLREPGHYPLADELPALCVTENLEPFSSTCGLEGPAGIRQTRHNYIFNCVFAD